jgi:hypothetical protein
MRPEKGAPVRAAPGLMPVHGDNFEIRMISEFSFLLWQNGI